MIAGAIDVGTNSVKLLVARVRGGRVSPLLERSEITRLGRGLGASGSISRASAALTIAAVERFRREAERLGCERLVAAGTQAIRVARNGRAFVRRCFAETGVRVEPISGLREAGLSYRGATSAWPRGATAAVEIGGGSTQLMAGRAGRLRKAVSLPLGAVSLTEELLRSDPATPTERGLAAASVRQRVSALPAAFRRELGRAERVVAIGGTALTLGRLAGGIAAERIDGRRLDRRALGRLLDRLSGWTAAERRRRTGLEPGRADIVVAGGIILAEAMDALGIRALTLSVRGLRTGLVLEAAGDQRG